MLFLALTGLVFAGVVGGTRGNMARERYRDSVQTIATELRNIYSQVENVEIPEHDDNICASFEDGSTHSAVAKRGRSACAVYGKLALIYTEDGVSHIQSATVFGRDYYDLEDKIRAAQTDTEITAVHSLLCPTGYKINSIDCSSINWDDSSIDLSSLSDIDQYKVLSADVGVYDTVSATVKMGFEIYDFTPQWGARIMTQGSDTEASREMRAMLLILRSPRTGVIHTYVYENEASDSDIRDLDLIGNSRDNLNTYGIHGKLTKAKEASTFKKDDFRICVDASVETVYDGSRRMIKVARDAHNETGVELVNLDTASEADTCH
jgi:hypothetical protein